jgi:hydrogenase-4 membrane subunit HyfE
MKETFVKITGGILLVVGIISALLVLLSFFIFSRPDYRDAPMYTIPIIFGIIFAVINIFLGINLLKSKRWVIVSTLIYSGIAVLSLIWLQMFGKYVPADKSAIEFWIGGTARALAPVVFWVFIIQLVIFFVMLSKVISKNES